MSYLKICEELKATIKEAYEQGTSMPDAERLAAKTLSARLEISDELKVRDLDSRLRKNGVKAVRAKAYHDEIAKHEKKPTEGLLENAVNTNKDVQAEEEAFAVAEVERDVLERYLDIFKDAHIHFRNVSRGSYE